MPAPQIDSGFLAQFPILNKLPVDALDALAAGTLARTLARREVVMQKGDPLKFLPLLLEGRLQGVDFTIDGREVGMYFVNPGEICGELSLIDRLPLSETIIATAPSQLLMLPREIVRSAIFSHPDTSEHLSLRLASRLRGLAHQRVVLSVQSPIQRLCAQLLHLALSTEGVRTSQTQEKRGAQASPSTPDAIDSAPTHQEIAIMINSSRETVTRAFQQLLAQRVLRRDGSRLIILNPKRLKDMASGQD